MEAKKIKQIISILEKIYPEPVTALNFSTPFELLVATILSAQTTDKQVNKVTQQLFQKYSGPRDFAQADQKELAQEISSIGLFHNKSKYLIETGKKIIEDFNGQVPAERKELMELPGVGRKTANVIMACAFSKNTIAVDTHVFRVSNRLGLADSEQVSLVEKQLMKQIPEDKWVDMHHWLIFHGRSVCKARNPLCLKCDLNIYCNYFLQNSIC